MTNQIFKKKIPNSILYELLEYIYVYKNDNYYIINNSSFKKAQFQDKLTEFYNIIEPYYYSSKVFYLKRNMTYSRFMTVIRQICNFNMIKYESNIQYSKSKYDIHYYIYFDDTADTTDTTDTTDTIDTTDTDN
jgi:hypothetical protein